MSRCHKLWLGLASLLLSGVALVVNTAVALMFWPASGVAAAVLRVLDTLLEEPPLGLLLAVAGGLALYLVCTVAGILMVIDCARRLQARPDLTPGHKRWGGGVLMVLNTIALPVAWYFLIWREPGTAPAASGPRPSVPKAGDP